MANGRSGRPVRKAESGTRAVLTLRLDGGVKNLAAELAAGFGMTVAEYIEALVLRDAGKTR